MPVDFATIVLLWSIVIFTASSPGPDVFYIVSNALSGSWKKGLVAWMGVLLATLAYAIATAFGLAALFATAPVLYEVVKWLGVFYLAYMGFLFLKSAITSKASMPVEKTKRKSLKKIFFQGFLVTILNPKCILFFTALIPQFVNEANGHLSLQFLILGLAAMLVGQLIYAIYTVVFVLIGRKVKDKKIFKGTIQPVRYLNAFCGVIYVSFFIALLFWKRA